MCCCSLSGTAEPTQLTLPGPWVLSSMYTANYSEQARINCSLTISSTRVSKSLELLPDSSKHLARQFFKWMMNWSGIPSDWLELPGSLSVAIYGEVLPGKDCLL